MGIFVGRKDTIQISLEGADDRVEIFANENPIGFQNVGDQPKNYDLRPHFRPGVNSLRIHGVDHQPVSRAVRFKVFVSKNLVAEENRSEASTAPYPNHWYDKTIQFEVEK